MLYLQKRRFHTKHIVTFVIVLYEKIPNWGLFYTKTCILYHILYVLHIFFDKTLDFYIKKHKICINFSPNGVNI